MKKVSVIIPCFNATQWLPQCFLSLVNQTIGIENLELIFVDDASSDEGKTWGMLKEFERAYPQSIMIIHLDENMRQGGARNIALKYASGTYISFVDADDFVAEDLYERTYQRAVETNADIVQFEYYLYTSRLGAVSAQRAVEPEVIQIASIEDRKRLLMAEKITYGCWNKLYRREFVQQAGVAYAEHVIYEEPLFVYPLLYHAKNFTVMQEPLYYYRQNDIGTMRSDMKQQETLLMHASVQKQVWDFMKQTDFFDTYYEEIKLYFLHTYFYETLYFAKQRGFAVTMELYSRLEKIVKQEVRDYTVSAYEAMIPKQMELYHKAKQGMTETMLAAYMDSL